MDNAGLGKLITYIKGFAAKLDAERRREATLRGRKATVRGGRMAGGFHITYGYDYIRVIKGERQARRVISIYGTSALALSKTKSFLCE